MLPPPIKLKAIAYIEGVGEVFFDLCLVVYHKISVEVVIQLIALLIIHTLTG